MWESRFTRLFAILGQLSPHSQITIQELAQEYEVDERTIERDIKALEMAKLGVFNESGRIKISRVGYRRIKSWLLS